MNEKAISNILGLYIPNGVCISQNGDLLWFNDSQDVLGLKDIEASNITELITDNGYLQMVLEGLKALSVSEQYFFPNRISVCSKECYVNVKNIGLDENQKPIFSVQFSPITDATTSSIPSAIVKVLGQVNVNHYASQLGIPFSLLFVIRDDEGMPVDLRFLFVNESYAELANKAVSDLTGLKYSEVFNSIDEDFVSMLGGISKENGSAKFIDFEKGLKRYTEISVNSPVEDIVGCVYSDITDLVLANKSLQQEEEYIRTLVDANPDIIFVFSNEGVFLDCHVSDMDNLFYGKSDFIGKPVNKVLSPELSQLTLMHIESVMINRRMEEYQYELEFSDSIRYYEARMVPHDANRVVCIVRDITKRKMVEDELDQRRKEVLSNNQFLKEVMEGVGYPLWVIDVSKGNKMVISDLNTQYEEVFGVRKSELQHTELEDIKKFYDKSYYESVVSHYYNCLNNKKATTHERVLVNKTSKKRIYLLVTLMPKLDSKGNVYRIIGSATDITGLKSTQDDLIMAKEKALEADKLKSAFLANMSHEIRTPLNSITGFSELIQDEDLSPEERQDMCRIIEKNSSQLLKLVNDIIEISKIESEQIKLIFRKFDINHLLNELVQELELDMYRKKKVIPFKVVKGVKDGHIFSSDEFRIKQVFQHLLDNALKFTSDGEIEFGYNIIPETEEVEFYVKDSGIGIPKDKQGSIFELFRQLDESSTRKYGGTGLGLSICKKLVGALDGDLWVDSEPDKGAKFTFVLKSLKGAID